MTAEELREYNEISDHYDVAKYINYNGLCTMREFLCELMSDVRSGQHVDWYDRLFLDPEFLKFAEKCCWLRGMGNLYITVTSLKLQMSLLRGCADMNAVGGGTTCKAIT
ncbi:MAG: hypothetical protein HDQ88_00930 [Clostridia bacterium]|nr:hypothetical protein [Clostridia bacterium]